jgi:allophanate hydrolase subunit 1
MSGPIDLPCNYSRPGIRPAGDSAVLVVLGERMDPVVNRRIHQLARAISANPLPGTGETVPGYATLLVHYDPLLIS